MIMGSVRPPRDASDMGEQPGWIVFGVVDWLARLTVPVKVGSAYGLLVGLITGVVLIAVSEVGWRLITGEWGNLWPSRLVMAYRRRPDDLPPDRPKGGRARLTAIKKHQQR
jgi:hypothetical protein